MDFKGHLRYIFSGFIVVFLALWSGVLAAQSLLEGFTPPVGNILPSAYGAGMQNWGMAQDKQGVLYVANNQGLLGYDGRRWGLHLLPSKKTARAVFSDGKEARSRVYVGSFEEFGYFERNAQNSLVYHSLKSLLKGYKFENDEVWKIVRFGGKVYFQTFRSYFVYDGQRVRAVNPSPAPYTMFVAQHKLYMQTIYGGLYEIDEDGATRLVLSKERLAGNHVIAGFESEGRLLLPTMRGGVLLYDPKSDLLQPFKTDFDPLYPQTTLNRAVLTSDGKLILGTLGEGVLAIEAKSGKRLWRISRSNGLNNNTVLGLLEDAQHNLWAALDNGIAQIQCQSKLLFLDLPNSIELVSDMAQAGADYYLGSNKGVYKLRGGSISAFANFNNQTWFVKRFDNQVFVGHNKGTSEIEDDRLVSLPNVGVGGMCLAKGVIHGQEVLIGSSYTFLTVYKKNAQGRWMADHIIDGFSDLIDRVEIDPAGNLWAEHLYKGIYRIALEKDLRHIKQQTPYNALGSNAPYGRVKLLRLRGKIVLADGYQFYTYDEDQQQVVPYQLLNRQLKDLVKTQRIVAVNDNLFWFITDSDYFLVHHSKGSYAAVDRIPFSGLAKPANEQRATVFVDERGQSFFCLDGSIAMYVPQQAVSKVPSGLQLRSLLSYDRDSDQYVHEALGGHLEIDYNRNYLVFQFQYPNFTPEGERLLYFLEGYDKRWGEASADFSLVYQSLPQGKYTLQAKVVDNLGKELSSFSLPFEITTPWYKSLWAYVLYGLLFLASCVILSVLFFRYRMKKKERAFLREKLRKQRQLEQQEREITALQNQMLATELKHKSKALAEATMMNIKHDDFLQHLTVRLEQFFADHKVGKMQSRPLIQYVRENRSQEDQWQVFQENFDMIHTNFFHNLKEQYPELTATDLKLCVLLRLNYTSKEIAAMQGVSIRGVETARYRLRKKLKLAEEENLYDFFTNFNR